VAHQVFASSVVVNSAFSRVLSDSAATPLLSGYAVVLRSDTLGGHKFAMIFFHNICLAAVGDD
jgi:hypothetical protein